VVKSAKDEYSRTAFARPRCIGGDSIAAQAAQERSSSAFTKEVNGQHGR
jgi:hypothetical protein